MDSLLSSYREKQNEIEKRLKEFKTIRSDEEIFPELIFCILTPQSRAKLGDAAVKSLFNSKAIFGKQRDIKKHLKGVRFPNQKTRHIIEARKLFLNGGIKNKLSGDIFEIREWLVENIYGLGYKEASHFLRNIGLGEELAILDRHVLKNLVKYGIVKEIPKSLTRKRYLEIEEKMKEFAQDIGIPHAHLDLLFWSQETGEIFK